jgi:hypothetical protein
MSSNNTDTTIVAFLAYYPFTLIIVGTLLNLITLIILCRPTFQDTSKRPTIHYMRVIAIFDILMLYGWNFDHYLNNAHGYGLQYKSVSLCKFFSFFNYFTQQVSAWIRVFICSDRYLSLSRLHKTWFSQSKNVLIIIAGVLTVFFIVNFHFFPFVCFYKSDGTVSPEGFYYTVYPLWDYINLALYNCVPFFFMGIFNTGVIYHLIRLRQTSTVQNSRIQHRSISITLVITTCLFLIMTTPATICFGFFQSATPSVIQQLFDYVLYTYHILSFPLYFITFQKFRRELIQLVKCQTRSIFHSTRISSILTEK